MSTATERYREFFIQSESEAYGACSEATIAMAAAFPELRRVRGHYYCPVWGERAHWWLTDFAGTIIDPTAIQFPSKGTGQYVEWTEGANEPTGMCPNCGEHCYEGQYFCSESCGQAYVAFCSGR